MKPIAKYYGTLYFEIAEPVPSISEESQESQNSKIKRQSDRAKFKNVVRGFSPVHDPEGSHYKRKACLAMT